MTAVKIEALKRGFDPSGGKYGVSGHPPSQPILAQEDAFLIVQLTGGAPWRGSDTSSPAWLRQVNLLKKLLTTLAPYFSFVADELDRDLLVNGEATEWPPLEPWNFCSRVMVYGEELVERFGRAFLSEMPAYRVEALGDGFWIQATDELFSNGYPVEARPRLTPSQRETFRSAVYDYLKLKRMS